MIELCVHVNHLKDLTRRLAKPSERNDAEKGRGSKKRGEGRGNDKYSWQKRGKGKSEYIYIYSKATKGRGGGNEGIGEETNWEKKEMKESRRKKKKNLMHPCFPVAYIYIYACLLLSSEAFSPPSSSTHFRGGERGKCVPKNVPSQRKSVALGSGGLWHIYLPRASDWCFIH